MALSFYGYFASIFMGLSLGLLGGGGSILTVPILVYLFGLDPILATTYSLFIVGVTALVGGIKYAKKDEVDFKTGIIFAIPSIIGIFVSRKIFVPGLPAVIFNYNGIMLTKSLLIMLSFSIVMVVASISMIKKKKEKSEKKLTDQEKNFAIFIQGLIVGIVAGFVGAGGGFLINPALVLLVGLSMKRAVGTSLFIIALNSFLGFFGDLNQLINPDWMLLLSVAMIAIIGLFFGTFLSDKFDDKTLKKSFGYFVLIMGVFILVDQIRKMS